MKTRGIIISSFLLNQMTETMKYILLSIALFLSTQTFAQKTVKGIVLDSQDSTAISLAHIYLKSQDNYGTVSNEVGKFSFTLPSHTAYDTLIISAIAYQTIAIPTKAINFQDTLTFIMQIDITSLDEFVVSPYSSEDSVKVIIQRTIQNLKNNYAQGLHYLSGFFRETSITEGKYSRLLEAAINIQDKGIKKNTEKTVRIEVEELRKSDDMRLYDVGLISYHKALAQQLGIANNNILIKLYEGNKIRSGDLDKDFLKFYDFEFVSLQNFENQRVITIAYKSNFGKYEQVMSVRGQLTINLGDYAIIKMISKNYTLGNSKENSIFTAQFKKHNGKYYPVYLEKSGKNFDKPSVEQYTIATLMVNEIVSERRRIDRIKKRFAESREDDLYDKDLPYHPDFWENYNLLLLAPIQAKTKYDLEINRKLEIQFKENSKK